MRYRLMATYRGVAYEAGVGPTHSDLVLFAACPPPEGLGFEPATGHWRKQVIWAEVDALWESRPVGIFRGEPCIVLDDLGDRLHIAYLGTDADRAARLGYWQVDRGVFELLIPREEVTSLTEERLERSLHPSVPDETAAAAPPKPTYPYRGPEWPTPPPPSVTFPGSANAGPALPGGWPGYVDSQESASVTGQVPSDAPLPGPARPEARSYERDRSHEPSGGRSARRRRVTTREIFCELADLAAIPRGNYALEAEVDGAMCLLAGADGFEVFVSVDGARHEVRQFADEEAAYFYLFGVLAADAVRNGELTASPAATFADGRP